MSTNVMILGAGFSAPAGLPVMDRFVDAMRDLALVGRDAEDRPLQPADVKLLQKTVDLCERFETYHGRVSVDSHNIEDVLGILATEAELAGRRKRLTTALQAVAATIELSCRLRHSGTPGEIHLYRHKEYCDLWHNLFTLLSPDDFPAIITTNYDLVLERSLFLLGNSTAYYTSAKRFPAEGVRLDLGAKSTDPLPYRFEYHDYPTPDRSTPGTRLMPGRVDRAYDIEILKLHGGLNVPQRRENFGTESVTAPLPRPALAPPGLGLNGGAVHRPVWKRALERLRAARRIVFVGYGLPAHDRDIRRLFRTALGPNSALDSVTIFDPLLFGDSEAGARLRRRYLDCFAPQFHGRLRFRPTLHESERLQMRRENAGYAGGVKHLVRAVADNRDGMFFARY